ncbi:MAG TPA: maleylpyruvate isomerase N-terminal domain-containing protein [Actinopolymorphaceae bacterium]
MATDGTMPLPVAEARRRAAADRDLLLDVVRGKTTDELRAPYRVRSGPLGDFCESLHDLLAHVQMWDEINLAVLAEARRGRAHWSVEPRWETPEVGQVLNRAGVAAGRLLPSDLLLHRFQASRDALLAELSCYDEYAWVDPTLTVKREVTSIGGLAQYVMTVPGQQAYWHAALHLGVPLDGLTKPASESEVVA